MNLGEGSFLLLELGLVKASALGVLIHPLIPQLVLAHMGVYLALYELLENSPVRCFRVVLPRHALEIFINLP